MRKTFEARRHAMALEVQSSIEDIPEYKVRTPLQSAIQILKRHRDMMFMRIERMKSRSLSLLRR